MPDADVQNPSPQPNRSPAPRSDSPLESQEPPPIVVWIGEDGRLRASCQDTNALDTFEDLIRQVGTPRKEYRQFTLKHMSAYSAKLNLEDYFREEKKDEKSTSRRSWFSEPPAAEPKQANRLSKRKQMKFIEDIATNTLLVVGGTAEQLANVEELITMWDVAPPKDSESARITTVVPIRYSKAQTVAETVKEVYRDLLSSTDRALQGGEPARPQAQNTYIFGDTGDGERRTKVTFKGKLSIGVDEVSNTLIVSTEGQNLMENVQKMIESLDVAAIPTTEVQVVTLKGGMNPDSVREALAKILGQTSSTSSSGTQAMGGMAGAGRRGGGVGGAAGRGTGGGGRGGGGGTGGGGGGGRGGGGGGGR
jgi:type II secretory pathway component GspD/PulD (secretin)